MQLLSPSVTKRVPLGVRGFGYVVGFEEKSETVEWQIKTLRAELARARENSIHEIVELRGAEVGPVWRALTELQSRPESQVIYKVSTRPSRVASYFARSAAGGPDLLFAEALSGIVWGASEGDAAEAMGPDRLQELINSPSAPQSECDEARVAIRRCPPAWKKTLPVWGRPGSDRELMRHVKRTLDPMNVFNPGRLFGDL